MLAFFRMKLLVTILLIAAIYFSYSTAGSVLNKEVSVVDNNLVFSDLNLEVRQLDTVYRYQVIASNPLFIEARKPFIEVVKKKVRTKEIIKQDLRVQALGIAVSGELFIAVVKDLRTGEILRLRVNEKIDEWRLKRVSADSFVFANGEAEKVIGFRKNGE